MPTEADARLWELETRAVAIRHRGAAPVTFADFAGRWLAGFIDDAPDQARFEAALGDWLIPALGERSMLEVLEADRNELDRLFLDSGADQDGGAVRECLHLIVEDAAEDLRNGVFDVSAPAREARSGCWAVRVGLEVRREDVRRTLDAAAAAVLAEHGIAEGDRQACDFSGPQSYQDAMGEGSLDLSG